MQKRRRAALAALLLGILAACGSPAPEAKAPPLKIAYSDWPGWIAWDIAAQKNFFKDAGVEVELVWFEYGPSMEAFAAGQVDAVAVTNGDALVTGATGARNVMILINDFSNGNDMVVARPGINTLADLKGKKIGVEVGFVDHLLLLKGLESVGLTEADVTLVNIATNTAAQVLASGDVDAIAAWQPNSGQALKSVSGSRAIFTSADVPGLIYDTLAVNPESLASRREDWAKVVKAWYQTAAWMLDPANKAEALEILSARVNLSPAEYEEFLVGTKILTLPEAKAAFVDAEGFTSIYGSTRIVDAFNVQNGVYTEPQNVGSYLDPSFVNALVLP